MILNLSKTFDFDAAHHLPNLPEGHKCRRPHGHTYRAEVVLQCRPEDLKEGMFVDYAVLAEAWKPVHELVDHRNLNDLIKNPTTEVLCQFIFKMFEDALPSEIAPFLRTVRVYESSTTYCEATRS